MVVSSFLYCFSCLFGRYNKNAIFKTTRICTGVSAVVNTDVVHVPDERLIVGEGPHSSQLVQSSANS